MIKIARDERRIGLSVKAAHYSADELAAEVVSFGTMKDGGDLMRLGDIIDKATNK